MCKNALVLSRLDLGACGDVELCKQRMFMECKMTLFTCVELALNVCPF